KAKPRFDFHPMPAGAAYKNSDFAQAAGPTHVHSSDGAEAFRWRGPAPPHEAAVRAMGGLALGGVRGRWLLKFHSQFLPRPKSDVPRHCVPFVPPNDFDFQLIEMVLSRPEVRRANDRLAFIGGPRPAIDGQRRIGRHANVDLSRIARTRARLREIHSRNFAGF